MVNQPMGNHGLGIFWCGRIGWLLWPISPLLLVINVLDVKTTYRKSCGLNLLLVSDLTLDHSFKVKCGSSCL